MTDIRWRVHEVILVWHLPLTGKLPLRIEMTCVLLHTIWRFRFKLTPSNTCWLSTCVNVLYRDCFKVFVTAKYYAPRNKAFQSRSTHRLFEIWVWSISTLLSPQRATLRQWNVRYLPAIVKLFLMIRGCIHLFCWV